MARKSTFSKWMLHGTKFFVPIIAGISKQKYKKKDKLYIACLFTEVCVSEHDHPHYKLQIVFVLEVECCLSLCK